MKVSEDAQLREAASDVTVRFVEHGQYGSIKKAISAFRRRAPGYGGAEYQEILGFYIGLLTVTVKLVGHSKLPDVFTKSEEESAQEYKKVLGLLRERYPEIEDEALLSTFINWVTYWYYLR